MIILKRSTELLREGRARAAMARPVSQDASQDASIMIKVIKNKSVAIVDSELCQHSMDSELCQHSMDHLSMQVTLRRR